MSRQIQFRRGTADEHATFTGAEGEITVDTTNKTIRVHDGTTPGGTMLARQSALDAIDYVIAWQTPTADNNYTWYRKYKSGWVEQGGIAKIATTTNRWAGVSVSFPIKMATSMYTATGTSYGLDGVSTILTCIGGINSDNTDNQTGKTQNGIFIQTETLYASSASRARWVHWHVAGMAA